MYDVLGFSSLVLFHVSLYSDCMSLVTVFCLFFLQMRLMLMLRSLCGLAVTEKLIAKLHLIFFFFGQSLKTVIFL